MKNFKLYEEFLNESLDKRLERATELAILFTLRQLLPDGGNCHIVGIDWEDWEKLDPMFRGGPDLYINFDDADSGDFSKEFELIYAYQLLHSDTMGPLRDEIENKFLEYGLQIEDLSPGENIVHVATQLKKSSNPVIPDELSPNELEFVVNFYKTREKKIKDLEAKYKLALISKKYGL